ncbi:MAG: hypothetical protein N2170_07500 [Bacteroidia bacterium]|nr:hypothetical protein [Bacteroidia bacterium]
MSPADPIQVHLVRECAQRTKYVIDLPEPLSLQAYQELADNLPGILSSVFLPSGDVLLQIKLLEKEGSITGSTNSATLHVLLTKEGHGRLLEHILQELRNQ